jgi:hypothetical protein
MPSDGNENRYSECGIASINRSDLVVPSQDTQPAVNDRINQNPKRQLVTAQPIEDAGNKGYSHREHRKSFACTNKHQLYKKGSNFDVNVKPAFEADRR